MQHPPPSIARARSPATTARRFGPTALPAGTLLLALALGGVSSGVETLSAAHAGIRAADAGRHAGVLADDSLEGREGGSRGGRAAAAYVVEQLERLEVRPAGDGGSWYQSFGGLRNVLALLPGSDPAVAHELVVVGAHYDHVGYGTASNSYGPFGFVHNGADDNASGVAGLLEVAEALTMLEARPRRPILIAFWDGEEQGLLGSRHFIRQRPAPLADAKIVFSLNLDMIGRLRGGRVEVYGTRTATNLRSVVTRANSDPANAAGLTLAFIWNIEDDSDHFPFIAAGVPTLMLHTGLHDQYHRPSDDAHLLNLDGIEPVARLTLGCIRAIADAETPPVYRAESRGESDATRRLLEAATPLAPGMPRGRWGLGSRADPGEPSAPVIVRVTPGSPADAAGMRAGDRVLQIDGEPFADHDDMLARLRASRGRVELVIDRGGQTRRLELQEQEPGPDTR